MYRNQNNLNTRIETSIPELKDSYVDRAGGQLENRWMNDALIAGDRLKRVTEYLHRLAPSIKALSQAEVGCDLVPMSVVNVIGRAQNECIETSNNVEGILDYFKNVVGTKSTYAKMNSKRVAELRKQAQLLHPVSQSLDSVLDLVGKGEGDAMLLHFNEATSNHQLVKKALRTFVTSALKEAQDLKSYRQRQLDEAVGSHFQ